MCEDTLREDMRVMLLVRVSMERQIGRKSSAGDVSKVSRQLTKAMESWRESVFSKPPVKYPSSNILCLTHNAKSPIFRW